MFDDFFRSAKKPAACEDNKMFRTSTRSVSNASTRVSSLRIPNFQLLIRVYCFRVAPTVATSGSVQWRSAMIRNSSSRAIRASMCNKENSEIAGC